MNELQTWLLPQAPGVPDAWRLAQTNECEVAVHLAYASYFKRLAELFDLTQSGDQIFLVGWEFGLDEELRPGDKTSAVLEQAIRQRGVRVRLLATGGGGTEGQNTAVVAQATKLGIDAELDMQVIKGTSHHQKSIYLTASGTSHLFVGGMDIALGFPPDRRVGKWFDAQAEITGRGAELGLLTLEERWASVKRTSFTPLFTPRKPKNDYTYIQFVRTYGKADQQAKDRHRKYALVGDFSYGKLLGHAIDNAKRFIYIEDQFFFDTNTPSASLDDRLKAAVARGVTIVVVAARMNEIESPPGGLTERRAALIKDLRANVAGKDRLYLLQYKLQSPAPQPYFVHTKTWIFDDQLAVIGSANYWTESMTTESEFGVAIASTLSTKEFPGVPFARALRVKMWERLLKAVPGAPVLKRDKKATFLQELAVLTGKGSPFEPMP